MVEERHRGRHGARHQRGVVPHDITITAPGRALIGGGAHGVSAAGTGPRDRFNGGALMRLRPLLTRAALAGSLMLGAALGVAAPARATTTCRPGGSVMMGKYWLVDDIQGETGSGWQCVWDGWKSDSTIGWGTSWSWSGRPTSVKSFAAGVLGWRWGTKVPVAGLPVRLSALRSAKTAWSFQAPGSGSFDIGYELWLHDVPNPDAASEPAGQVVIWLYGSGGATPQGVKVAKVKIAGTSWDLYEGRTGWDVYSFVRTSNTSSATLDLKDFLDQLRTRRGLGSSTYLSGVAAGIEVFTGTGQLTTTSYRVDVQ
jgi:hypothetical protein